MFKRLFFALVGLGAGVTLGVVAVHKAQATQQRLRPGHLAASAGSGAGGLRDRLAVAVEQGRVAAEAKEAELRTRYRLPSRPAAPPEPSVGPR